MSWTCTHCMGSNPKDCDFCIDGEYPCDECRQFDAIEEINTNEKLCGLCAAERKKKMAKEAA